MTVHVLLLALAGLVPGGGSLEDAVVQGVVVNDSQGGTPAAGAEVVLLAGKDGHWERVANTTTGPTGRFVFERLPLAPSPELVYAAGAHWDGVHYPGPRFHLAPGGAPVAVRLTVHDAVASPCPLVAEVHQIDLRVNTGFLDVTELVVVNNPSSTTYVGTASPDASMTATTTLSLALPPGVAHVTFNKQFDAENFQLVDGHLVTNVPWPPGKRQLAFIYQVPVEDHQLLFRRTLDLPCSYARVAVTGPSVQELACNLPDVAGPERGPAGLAFAGRTLPAGYTVELQMRRLSAPWTAYARWATVLALGASLAGTAYLAWRRRPGDHHPVRTRGRNGRSSGRFPAPV